MSKSDPNESADQDAIPTAGVGPGTPLPGGQMGPCKILSVLGEGGYGIVYLAERQTPVHRRVALKVIKPGLADPAPSAGRGA